MNRILPPQINNAPTKLPFPHLAVHISYNMIAIIANE
jgi:hypothetical protein